MLMDLKIAWKCACGCAMVSRNAHFKTFPCLVLRGTDTSIKLTLWPFALVIRFSVSATQSWLFGVWSIGCEFKFKF